MKIINLWPLLLLASCATQVQTKIVTQTVNVPIPVACQTPSPTVPEFCLKTLTSDADVFTAVKCLLSDNELHKGYETNLSAALDSCK